MFLKIEIALWIGAHLCPVRPKEASVARSIVDHDNLYGMERQSAEAAKHGKICCTARGRGSGTVVVVRSSAREAAQSAGREPVIWSQCCLVHRHVSKGGVTYVTPPFFSYKPTRHSSSRATSSASSFLVSSLLQELTVLINLRLNTRYTHAHSPHNTCIYPKGRGVCVNHWKRPVTVPR